MPDINWNEPLETTDGRRGAAVRAYESPGYWVQFGGSIDMFAYLLDGTPVEKEGIVTGPRLRNVRPVRTADEALQRMEALVRRLATGCIVWATDEAREIVALLPEPVDPDIAEAKAVTDALVYEPTDLDDHGRQTYDYVARAALAGIKRGRELATP